MCLHSPLVPAGDLLTPPHPAVVVLEGGRGVWYTARSKGSELIQHLLRLLKSSQDCKILLIKK